MTRSLEAQTKAAARPRVLVSVLAYNSPDSTAETLRSLRRQTYPDFHLLLIDNASDDDSAGRLAREFPELEIRRLPENRGYTGGNNVAPASRSPASRGSLKALKKQVSTARYRGRASINRRHRISKAHPPPRAVLSWPARA